MIVGNWMKPNPLTITSDVLVSDAKRLISEQNLHAIPVVEHGRLRGLITRANLFRMVQFVLRTQNADEFGFLVHRLRVRDIMVRNPATVQVDETMERCLKKGRELGVAQFPVMQGERVVGIISANEIFQLAAHCLGAWEKGDGVTLKKLHLGPGVLGRIAEVAQAAGAVLHAIYPIGWNEKTDERDEKHVILRFHAESTARVVAALEAAGFPVVESSKLILAA
jgi:acetoin utilization protein AcuB